MAITAAVPSPRASGTLRPGSLISSATYAAAFHPEYVNITGISASSHAPGGTADAPCWRPAEEPAPTESPSAMKISRAETFKAASTFPTTRPGPTPRRWIQDINAIAASATADCREKISGTNGSGIVKIGVVSAAAGTNLPTYNARTTALAAIAPEKPATKDVHPVRNAIS